MPLRVFTGFCAGLIYAAALAALGVHRDTDRAFALGIILQLVLAALGLYGVAALVDRHGFDGVLHYLIAVTAVTAIR